MTDYSHIFNIIKFNWLEELSLVTSIEIYNKITSVKWWQPHNFMPTTPFPQNHWNRQYFSIKMFKQATTVLAITMTKCDMFESRDSCDVQSFNCNQYLLWKRTRNPKPIIYHSHRVMHTPRRTYSSTLMPSADITIVNNHFCTYFPSCHELSCFAFASFCCIYLFKKPLT